MSGSRLTPATPTPIGAKPVDIPPCSSSNQCSRDAEGEHAMNGDDSEITYAIETLRVEFYRIESHVRTMRVTSEPSRKSF